MRCLALCAQVRQAWSHHYQYDRITTYHNVILITTLPRPPSPHPSPPKVEAQAWVRNGASMINRVGNYRGNVAREWLFGADLMTLQICAAAIGVPHLLAAARNRFELDPLLGVHVNAPLKNPTLEPAQLVSIQERFLELLLHLYTHRYHVGLTGATEEEGLRYHAIQVLASGPRAFSSIVNKFDGHDRRDPVLSAIVKDVAVFNESTSTYELKEELLPQANPFYMGRLSADVTRCMSYLAKRLGQSAYQPPPPLPQWTEPLRGLASLPSCDRVLRMVFVVLARAVGGVEDGQFTKQRTVVNMVTEHAVAACLQLLTVALVQDGASGEFCEMAGKEGERARIDNFGCWFCFCRPYQRHGAEHS